MAEGTPGGEKYFSIGKAAAVVLGLYLTTTVSLNSFLFVTLQNLQIQLAGIEANRFTIADGIELRDRLAQSERAIGRLPDAFPPTWFMSDYRAMKTEILEMTKRINSLDKEVSAKCQR